MCTAWQKVIQATGTIAGQILDWFWQELTASEGTWEEVNVTVFPEVLHKLNSYILDALEGTSGGGQVVKLL